MSAVWCEEEGCWDLELQRLWKGQGWWCLHPQVSSFVWFVQYFLQSKQDFALMFQRFMMDVWKHRPIWPISSPCIWTWQCSGFDRLLSKNTTQYQGQMQILVCQSLWWAILFTLHAVSKNIYWLDNFATCAAQQALLLCKVQSTGWESRLRFFRVYASILLVCTGYPDLWAFLCSFQFACCKSSDLLQQWQSASKQWYSMILSWAIQICFWQSLDSINNHPSMA
jgi:hypothetical protein